MKGNESLVTSVEQMPVNTKPTDILQWQISNNKQLQEATYIGQQQQTIGFAAGSKQYSDDSSITHSIHSIHNTQSGNLVNS